MHKDFRQLRLTQTSLPSAAVKTMATPRLCNPGAPAVDALGEAALTFWEMLAKQKPHCGLGLATKHV